MKNFRDYLTEARKPKGFSNDEPSHKKVMSIIKGGWGKSDGVIYELKPHEAVITVKGSVQNVVYIIDGYTDIHNFSLNDVDGKPIKAGDIKFTINKISDLEYTITIK